MRKVALLIGLVFVSVLLMPFAGAYEFQAYGRITKVVDGDTVWFHSYYGYRAGETFKIRFADINAPEIYTEEGKESKAALEWLLDNYGYYVFLDVDDVYETDHYGRVVAVLYLPFWNYGYALNINEWLVENGYASIWDHYNEFNPYSWTLWVPI
ncbi:thermonuclease family protein [Thermococcus celer]|uniref:Nuclease n=1 Tax=Thermococcus celer Vu 13 = JCM 8558 TaxID=1293037 RepID=A0A218P395_THECE|nr:thermonuclease family protein [Thermococcus celer]ASI99387.1 nuclease [Thermococcus celer] [Thermococcus celer Vu 13 = JCM 8558]